MNEQQNSNRINKYIRKYHNISFTRHNQRYEAEKEEELILEDGQKIQEKIVESIKENKTDAQQPITKMKMNKKFN